MPQTPFCLIIHPIFWAPSPFGFFFSLHSPHMFFSSLSSSPSSFYTLFTPPKSSLYLINPHSTSCLLSFLQTTPQSYIISQFNHCTSESYEFLCSYLFVLLENPLLAFILLLSLLYCCAKNRLLYFFTPFICLARRWLC